MLQNFINKVVTFQRVCARTLKKPLLESNLEANLGTRPPPTPPSHTATQYY